MVALGGNALLERGEVPEAEIQEKHVAAAVEALVPLARDHDLLVTHGNGPQVGPDAFVEWVSLCQGARLQGADRALTVGGDEDFSVLPLTAF